MKKKFFAVALATTMALSTVLTASAETLTGTDWWTGSQTGADYVLSGDGSALVKINVTAGNDDNYAALCVEVTDGTNYLTTTSDGDAWWASATQDADNATIYKKTGQDALTVGNTYEMTVTRSGNKFTVKYVDTTTGAELFGGELGGTSTTEFANDVNVHVMAQVGTFDSEITAAPANADTGSDAGTGEGGSTGTGSDAGTGEGSNAGTSTGEGSSTGTGTGSNNNPPTSDVAPIAAFAAVAVVACAAVVVSRKKVTE